jgi:hypothetical protein
MYAKLNFAYMEVFDAAATATAPCNIAVLKYMLTGSAGTIMKLLMRY